MPARKLLFICLTFLCLASTGAHARSSVPIENHENVAVVTASGKAVTAERVRQAFVLGGMKRGWRFEDAGDGQLTGTLNVRGKHTVMVTVNYGPERYSILYKDSTNMKYDQDDGQAVIHPFYNKWVQNLMQDVGMELAKLQ